MRVSLALVAVARLLTSEDAARWNGVHRTAMLRPRNAGFAAVPAGPTADRVTRTPEARMTERPGPAIYCVSDIHTNYAENRAWVEQLPERPGDCLILAGDVAETMSQLQETLAVLRRKFGAVVFVVGNHDLYQEKAREAPESEPAGSPARSEPAERKLERVLALCEQEGVHTGPVWVGGTNGTLIAPLCSWYEAAWDEEPDVPEGEPYRSDSFKYRWACNETAAAALLDARNARFGGALPGNAVVEPFAGSWEELLAARAAAAKVISVSHFLPWAELLPEKRFLFYPPLAKMVGSRPLRDRVEALAPDVHVFGHTHFGWVAPRPDAGTLCVQVPLGNPREWRQRKSTMLVARRDAAARPDFANLDVPLKSEDWKRYESLCPELPCRLDNLSFETHGAFWSDYYSKIPRDPDNVDWRYKGIRRKKRKGK